MNVVIRACEDKLATNRELREAVEFWQGGQLAVRKVQRAIYESRRHVNDNEALECVDRLNAAFVPLPQGIILYHNTYDGAGWRYKQELWLSTSVSREGAKNATSDFNGNGRTLELVVGPNVRGFWTASATQDYADEEEVLLAAGLVLRPDDMAPDRFLVSGDDEGQVGSV